MIETHVTLILVVTGLLTMGAIIMFVMPRSMRKLFFGVAGPDEVTTRAACHWGLLVALIAACLSLRGYHRELRVPIMAVAVVEKLIIAGLVLGSPLRRRPLPVIIVAQMPPWQCCISRLCYERSEAGENTSSGSLSTRLVKST